MDVPHDIAFEIFSRLPAKSICKLKPTCNSFSKFSEEIIFKTKQARNLLRRDNTCLFIQKEQITQKYHKRIELHSLPKEKQSSGIPNNVLKFLSNSTTVLASSNGLVLCGTVNYNSLDLFICNPITKSWSSIPTSEPLQINHNLENIPNIILDCSHDDLDDYSVFLFEPKDDDFSTHICNVYHGKEGAWKTMKNCFFSGGRNLKFDMPVFYNGAVHFISYSYSCYVKPSPFYEPYIMSYNVEEGTSTMLKLPREAIRGCIRGCQDTCDMSIFNWGKASSSNSSICLVKLLNNSVFTVWFLKDYKSSSWQEVLEVKVKALRLKEKDPVVTGFTVMNGGLLVITTEKNVYSCNLEDYGKFMMVEEMCQHNCGSNLSLISYSDTLRSCGTNATTMPC